MRLRHLAPAICCLLPGLTGCSYSVFNDLEDKAPAARIDQEDGPISSASFGDQLAGLPRGGQDQLGGVLAAVGNGDAALSAATINESGSVSVVHADGEHISEQLGDPNRITSLAPAPAGLGVAGQPGPFAYVGTLTTRGKVHLVDLVTMRSATTLSPPDLPAPVSEFGAAAAAARLNGQGAADDLVVGAKGALVLIRSGSAGWPQMEPQASWVTVGDPTSPDWPSGTFSVVTVADLDPATDGDEVVAAAPDISAVVIAHHLQDCFQSPATRCTSFRRLPAPAGALRFGAALLVADVDRDGQLELLVGAPSLGQVLVYDLDTTHFASPTPADLPQPTATLQVSEADELGASLAFGKVAGSDEPVLVVGAPATEAGGAKSAGKLYLFDENLQQMGDGVQMANPEQTALLGRRLAVVPFHRGPDQPERELLAASGRDALFVFFSGLTATHTDVREK